jgi:hypothetical protein
LPPEPQTLSNRMANGVAIRVDTYSRQHRGRRWGHPGGGPWVQVQNSLVNEPVEVERQHLMVKSDRVRYEVSKEKENDCNSDGRIAGTDKLCVM